MRRSLWIVLVCLFIVAAGSPAQAGYKGEYKLSLVVAPASSWGQAAQKFADEVKAASGGKINIKCYFAGKLFAGKQTNEFMLLRQGVADFALGSTINWSPQMKVLNIFSMPFLFPNYEALDAVKNGDAGKKILAQIEKAGVISLGWGENGFREITNRVRPITSPKDLEGLKIRVVGSPIFKDAMRALGANPVLMNWGDAQTAFQQGTVDGQENPINVVIIPYKIFQYHKYITVWHYTIDPLILGVCKKTWDSFSLEDRKMMRAAADKALAWQLDQARQGLTGDMAALKKLEAEGMQVTQLTPAQLKIFKDKVKSVWDDWTPRIGVSIVNSAVAAVEANQ